MAAGEVLRQEEIPKSLTQTPWYSQITCGFSPDLPAPKALDLAVALRAGTAPSWLLENVDCLVENPDASLSYVASMRLDRAEVPAC